MYKCILSGYNRTKCLTEGNAMRAAIIGVGSIAPTHINALKKAGHDIVALCDIKPEKCEAAKAKFGLDCHVYDDYKVMLTELRPDTVHVCVPHYLHAPITCDVLAMDINVLCEKPVAISREQLAMLEVAVKKSRAKLGVCHQNRYNSASVEVKEFLEGKTVSSATGNLCWCRDAAYYSAASWRGFWTTEGGGVMMNQALHTLDLLQWICGMPESVTATIENHSLKGVIEEEDTAYGLFEVNDTTNFIINATNCSHHSFAVNFAVSTTDSDEIYFFGNNLIINGEYKKTADKKPEHGKAVYGNSHQRLIADFYDCLENGREFSLGLSEARKVIELILAMYESKGECISIK